MYNSQDNIKSAGQAVSAQCIPGQTTANRETEVAREMNILQDRIGQVQELAQRLEDRLSVVLCPQSPALDSLSKPVPPIGTPLANALSDYSARLQRCIDNLKETINRVEL